MGSMFNSTAAKVTGLPGIGGKGGGSSESAKPKAMPVLLNTSAERAKAQQRKSGMANSILGDSLGGAGDSGAL